MPFGGGGALHAGALVRDVGLKGALVPRYPGVTSALGCIIADVRHDEVRTLNAALATIDEDAFAALLGDVSGSARSVVDGAGIPLDGIDVKASLDMHYVGQTHTVAVPFEGERPSRADLQRAFEAAYLRAFGRLLEGLAVRIVSLRVAAIGRRPPFDLKSLAPEGGSVEAARLGSRPIVFGGARHESAVFDRLALPVGARVEGPAVLEQPDATVLVEPQMAAEVDALGNVRLAPT
ncbi:MAG: hydantoinase/oxoprolinase family protein [Pseudomonadota bacterium]